MRAAISLIFLTFSIALGQDSPEARAILDKVSEAAKVGRTYRAEFSGSAENKGTPSVFTGHVIFQPPGKVHTEVNVGKAATVMISDGEQTWIYLAAIRRYVKVRAGSRPDIGSPDASMLSGGSVNGLVSAQRSPDENVVLDGSAVHCYVITADFENSQGTTGPIHFIIWIDQTNYVILRMKASSVQTNLDFTVNKLTWEPALTGNEFVFTAPEGTTEMVLPTAAPKVNGTIRTATLIKRVNPVYPADAKAAHVEGTVRFTALLGKDGTVKDLQLVSGPPMLVESAMAAVKQWVYQPTLLNGEAVEVRTQIVVNFRLDPAAGTYRVGGGVSPPHVISKSDPQYSAEALRAKLEGSVAVSLIVGVDGTPRDIKVVRSLGMGLDEKAVEAIGSWRFAPGDKEGNPVAVLAKVEVNFRLLGKAGEWHLTRASFTPPEGASLPSVLRTKFPRDAAGDESGSVVVTLNVDERGRPVDVRVEKSSDAKWEKEVIAAVGEWRFEAGGKDGPTVVVPLTLEFSQGVRSAAPAVAPPAKGQ